jgi:hypothetical protein
MENPMTSEPDPRQLRNFGLMVGGIFGAIGLWPVVFRGSAPRLWAVALAVALVLPAVIAPRILTHTYRAWMALGQGLSWVNTRIILGAVFYAVITPMGVVMRLGGYDPMRRRIGSGAGTYRVTARPRAGAHMRRQF